MTARAPATTAAPPSRIHVKWAGAHRFDAGRPNGPTARIDGEGETGQSPPETLLTALATCVSYDVIDILGEERLIPGFEGHLEGLRVGESTEFDITFPDDYAEPSLAGKPGGPGGRGSRASSAAP